MNLSAAVSRLPLLVAILLQCCKGEENATLKSDWGGEENATVESDWDSDSYAELCRLRIGCRCSIDTSVVDCSDLRLSDLPLDISFPRQVTTVKFQFNHIKSIADFTFFHSPGVEKLDFSNNSLTYIAPSSFVGFENLLELLLSHNQLVELSAMILDGLSELRVLDLSHNEITTLQPSMFKPCPLLVELKLHNNPLNSLHPDSFKYIPELYKLDLRSTQLKKLPDDIFLNNPRLNSLTLADNPFFDIPTLALSYVKHLTLLDFSNTLIPEVKPHAFRGLTNLSVLFLDYQREMITIEKEAFYKLQNLETLHCSFNPVLGYIHPSAFEKNWPRANRRLRQVHLRDNDLKFISEKLLPWDSIEYVDLRGNPWFCDCNLKWMAKHDVKKDFREDLRCTLPENLAKREIASLSQEDFTCTPLLNYDEFLTLIILLTAFFIISVIVSLTLMCRHSVCLVVRSKLQHRYVEMLPDTDKLDLEWDYSADP